ncbi:response regulator [Sphingobacterium faecium]|uniref:response regulator n=1 Tax=Sphingobacterium faecium TaxID=34087 RepID=UPI0012925469|nr:response regulator [Sphingobacterium faecium]MQP26843.1 response regulator [Sphingobacterium faecium]
MEPKLKLVFVDDCVFQQAMMKMLIKRMEIFDLYFTCNDGAELIDRLVDSDFLPEICILDLHMPHMGGIATAHEISARFPDINVFGYTASGDEEEIEDFKRNGAVHIFSKTNPRSMLDQIYLWTNGTDPFDENTICPI